MKMLKLYGFTYQCVEKKIEVAWKIENLKIFKIFVGKMTGTWIMFQIYVGLLSPQTFSIISHVLFLQELEAFA